MWPGLVVDESHISAQGILNKTSVGRSVSVQFFGTHDFARFGILDSQVLFFQCQIYMILLTDLSVCYSDFAIIQD